MRFLNVALVALLGFLHPSGDPYTRMVDKVSASVVKIHGEKDFETFFGTVHGGYSCTGFVIAQHRVLTAAHCLGEKMTADGVVAKPLAGNQYYDLAVLDVDTKKAPLQFRDEPVVRFEELTGVGYAFGWDKLMAMHERVLITNYIVDDEGAPGIVTQGGYIGGMSGGPVVDSDGRVVGVVQQSNEGIGYGVGILIIRAFLLEV